MNTVCIGYSAGNAVGPGATMLGYQNKARSMTEDEIAIVSMRWWALTEEECRTYVAAMVEAGRTTETTMTDCFRGCMHVKSKSRGALQFTIERMTNEGLITAREEWKGKPDMMWIAEHGTPKGGLRFDSGPDGFWEERGK